MRQVLTDLLARSFPNLLPAQIALFVQGLFTIDDLTLFKNHLRDFLVQLKACLPSPLPILPPLLLAPARLQRVDASGWW